MRKKSGRGFRGQLKLDITRLQRRKGKIESRVQKLIQELMLIDNLIKAMEVARNPEAATPATEAAQVAEGTQKANSEMDALLFTPKPTTDEMVTEAVQQVVKDEPNVQAEG